VFSRLRCRGLHATSNGKVNFGCDDHARSSTFRCFRRARAAAGVSRLGAYCPTGCADKPSGTVSYGWCGHHRLPGSLAHVLPTPWKFVAGATACISANVSSLSSAAWQCGLARISPQMSAINFAQSVTVRCARPAGPVEQREFRGGAARVKRLPRTGECPRLARFISGARRPESARADAQWLKQSFAQSALPTPDGELFQHRPRENVADVGIPVFGVRRDSWRGARGPASRFPGVCCGKVSPAVLEGATPTRGRCANWRMVREKG